MNKNYRFETMQLHVGQEQADPATGARAAGLEIGLYFFSQAVSPEEAEEEAQWILDAAQNYDVTLPLGFDWDAQVDTGEDTPRTAGMLGGERIGHLDDAHRIALGFDEGNRRVLTVMPSFCDIDVNGHVNNAMYAKYVVNAFEPDGASAIKSFQIDYRQEAKLGEPLTVHSLVEDGRVLAKGLREDGEISFASIIELA